jgi:lipoyl-dependent peroxiredoxin
MKRSAQARWKGDLKSGKGLITTQSGAITDLPYSFSTRFERGYGSNPEELIAAAHAGCFAMALSAELGKSNISFDEICATADVNLDKEGESWKIGEVHLTVQSSVKSEDQGKFLLAANKAKVNCPISKLLNTTITLEVTTNEIQGEVSFPLDL